MMPVQAGHLRHRVEFQSPSEVRDEYGDASLTWTTTVTRWAKIEPFDGSERLEAAQVQGQVTHRVFVRSHVRPRPAPRDRLVFQGRIFRIEYVIDIGERGRVLELLVREEV